MRLFIASISSGVRGDLLPEMYRDSWNSEMPKYSAAFRCVPCPSESRLSLALSCSVHLLCPALSMSGGLADGFAIGKRNLLRCKLDRASHWQYAIAYTRSNK